MKQRCLCEGVVGYHSIPFLAMYDDLNDELEAIQSIYGEHTLRKVDDGLYVLSIPQSPSSIRLSFPIDYPESSPQVLGTDTIGEHMKKGYGRHIVDTAQATIGRVFIPGSVCLFDLLQELEVSLAHQSEFQESLPSVNVEDSEESVQPLVSLLPPELEEEPKWITSAPVIEKKSTFVARACSVKNPLQAKACVVHLLDTEKRVAKATHNITAYRIRSPAASASTNEIIYQDCDDDGETAAGGRLLHLLQVMDVWNVLVVVSRWYGGVKLGPERFSIINNVAREAVVEGGWTRSRIMKD